MNILSTIQSVRSKWTTAFPTLPLAFQLANASAKPPYAVMRLGDITSNEPTTTARDWETTATFYLFDNSDSAVISNAQTLVDAFDRSAISSGYASLVQSVSIDVNYTDQGALWSATVPIQFRWTS